MRLRLGRPAACSAPPTPATRGTACSAPHPVGIVDRAAGERESEALLETGCSTIRGRARCSSTGDAAPGDGLGWLAPAVIRDELGDEVEWAFLGRDGAAAPVVAATTGRRDEPWPRLPDGWLSLREAGATLPAPDAELLTVAVSISRFLGERFCSRCGSEAHLAMAGWSRRCTGCGAELFPRTDPAIIVATESVDGSRLLLGANAAWQGRMYSCFAGFVEAGGVARDRGAPRDRGGSGRPPERGPLRGVAAVALSALPHARLPSSCARR